MSDVLCPAQGFDSLVKMEYEKGVRAGMLLAIRLPLSIIENLDIDIEQLQGEIGENEDGDY